MSGVSRENSVRSEDQVKDGGRQSRSQGSSQDGQDRVQDEDGRSSQQTHTGDQRHSQERDPKGEESIHGEVRSQDSQAGGHGRGVRTTRAASVLEGTSRNQVNEEDRVSVGGGSERSARQRSARCTGANRLWLLEVKVDTDGTALGSLVARHGSKRAIRGHQERLESRHLELQDLLDALLKVSPSDEDAEQILQAARTITVKIQNALVTAAEELDNRAEEESSCASSVHSSAISQDELTHRLTALRGDCVQEEDRVNAATTEDCASVRKREKELLAEQARRRDQEIRQAEAHARELKLQNTERKLEIARRAEEEGRAREQELRAQLAQVAEETQLLEDRHRA